MLGTLTKWKRVRKRTFVVGCYLLTTFYLFLCIKLLTNESEGDVVEQYENQPHRYLGKDGWYYRTADGKNVFVNADDLDGDFAERHFQYTPITTSVARKLTVEELETGLSYMTCTGQLNTNCLIHNLYYIDGEFHVFMPGLNSRFSAFSVFTGIGFQSPNITITINKLYPPAKVRNVPRLKKVASIFSVMWENLFRTVYAGCGAWYTMMAHKVFHRDHQIILKDSEHRNKFIELFEHVGPNQVIFLSNLGNVRLETAVIGISKEFRIKEIEVEHENDGVFNLRKMAFRGFAHAIRNNIQKHGRRVQHNRTTISVGWVTRTGRTRRIINEPQLLEEMQKKPNIQLTVFKFESQSLSDQIQQASSIDVLAGMHGAGLAHVFFMRPESTLVELNPYGFQKRVYQNLARLMGVKYVYWRNTIPENTIFNWTHVEANKLTTRSKEDIVNLPVDWYNMDSKNYWRNQDTIVDFASFFGLLDIVLNHKSTKFLMAMPWEQLNNQLIELKSACAASKILDRVLVLPYLGYRMPRNSRTWDFSFHILNYIWEPIEDYFEEATLAQLPCKVISLGNFKSLVATHEPYSLGKLHFNPVAHATSKQQLIDYYVSVLNFTFDSIVSEERMYQLTKQEIQSKFAADESKVLTIGCMFWFYNFGRYQEYPLRSYANYMTDAMYTQIVGAVRIHSDYVRLAMDVTENVFRGKFLAVHVRRGDYWNKCKRLTELDLQANCYPSTPTLLRTIRNKARENDIRVIYIATNLGGDRQEFAPLEEAFEIYYHQDVFSATSAFNSNQKALLDMALCSLATDFIGNFYSSFSRTIFEQRELMQQPFSTF
jgi:hypothetical protein